jgi:hypothetical protein
MHRDFSRAFPLSSPGCASSGKCGVRNREWRCTETRSASFGCADTLSASSLQSLHSLMDQNPLKNPLKLALHFPHSLAIRCTTLDLLRHQCRLVAHPRHAK